MCVSALGVGKINYIEETIQPRAGREEIREKLANDTHIHRQEPKQALATHVLAGVGETHRKLGSQEVALNTGSQRTGFNLSVFLNSNQKLDSISRGLNISQGSS